jgi:hypothetical protein
VPRSQKGPFIDTREMVAYVGLNPAPMAGAEPLEPRTRHTGKKDATH